MRPTLSTHRPIVPRQYRPHLGWVVGLGLVAMWWPVSWLQVKPFSEYAFFPMWLGYILAVDPLVLRRKGTSLMSRSPKAFLGMFLVSVPLWWTFEAANEFTENWYYVGAEDYSTLRYALVASWHFSIVVPAVFETAELIGSFSFVRRFQHGPTLPASGLLPLGAILLGFFLFAALVFWPDYAFPGTWLCLFLAGPNQPPHRVTQCAGVASPRRLASRVGVRDGSVGLRMVLGDVELLGFPEVAV